MTEPARIDENALRCATTKAMNLGASFGVSRSLEVCNVDEDATKWFANLIQSNLAAEGESEEVRTASAAAGVLGLIVGLLAVVHSTTHPDGLSPNKPVRMSDREVDMTVKRIANAVLHSTATTPADQATREDAERVLGDVRAIFREATGIGR